MKLLVLIAVLLSAEASLACSQPPKAWIQEKWELAQLLGDPQLNQRLDELDADRIANIKIQGGLFTISTNKACSVVARAVYAPPTEDGLCPSFRGFETSVDCPIRD